MRITTMKSRFKGHCQLCLYTIWPGELINFNGSATHLNCETAIKDNTPRRMKEGRNQEEWDKINKNQFKATLSKKILARRS